MPRLARKKSNSEIYHVMLRGIDKRDIFLEKTDYQRFLTAILKAKEKSIFEIYAYCLMTNHVHILLKSQSEEIGDVLRRITVSYVLYHNNKYGRVGHLFQNRFKSEPIGNDRHFLTVLRYIHQNPTKAGMVSDLSNYPWSSYFEYIDNDEMNIVNTSFALDHFSSDENFREFLMSDNNDVCLEQKIKSIYTDEKLLEIISSISDVNKIHELDTINRNIEILKIRDKTSASNRQLSRVLNIGRWTLDRIR